MTWTPVSEGLPQDGCDVLISWTHGDLHVTDLGYHSNDRWWRNHQETSYTVTAWQPLPEPYKEGE